MAEAWKNEGWSFSFSVFTFQLRPLLKTPLHLQQCWLDQNEHVQVFTSFNQHQTGLKTLSLGVQEELGGFFCILVSWVQEPGGGGRSSRQCKKFESDSMCFVSVFYSIRMTWRLRWSLPILSMPVSTSSVVLKKKINKKKKKIFGMRLNSVAALLTIVWAQAYRAFKTVLKWWRSSEWLFICA